MKLRCNTQAVGEVEHVEWKDREEGASRVAFMAPFDFDWNEQQENYLEL